MNFFLVSAVLLALTMKNGYCWNKAMENPGLYEGDIVLTPDQRKAVSKGSFAYGSVTYGRWPGAKVPYFIQNSIGEQGRQAIANAIADYHRYTCIRFNPTVGGERNYISFFSGGGCSSPVGMNNGGANQVSLGPRCWDKGTALHEIGHSLGMFHEQSRPDRDAHVTINWRYIQQGMSFNFDIQSGINSLGTPYDLNSMMHYSSTAFSGWAGYKTIVTKDPSKQSIIDTNNRISGFSQTDILQLQLMYGCSGGGVVTQTPVLCNDANQNCAIWARNGECSKNPGYMLVNCKKSCNRC